jgi:hypothetical protein
MVNSVAHKSSIQKEIRGKRTHFLQQTKSVDPRRTGGRPRIPSMAWEASLHLNLLVYVPHWSKLIYDHIQKNNQRRWKSTIAAG